MLQAIILLVLLGVFGVSVGWRASKKPKFSRYITLIIFLSITAVALVPLHFPAFQVVPSDKYFFTSLLVFSLAGFFGNFVGAINLEHNLPKLSAEKKEDKNAPDSEAL